MGKHMSTLKERKLKFETLQLHVGQEEPDPVTVQEQFRFTRHLPTYSTIQSMQQTVSVCVTQEIFTED